MTRVTTHHATPEAMADELERMAPLIRSRTILGISVEYGLYGTSRVAYTLAPGAQVPELDLEVTGVSPEEDER